MKKPSVVSAIDRLLFKAVLYDKKSKDKPGDFYLRHTPEQDRQTLRRAEPRHFNRRVR